MIKKKKFESFNPNFVIDSKWRTLKKYEKQKNAEYSLISKKNDKSFKLLDGKNYYHKGNELYGDDLIVSE